MKKSKSRILAVLCILSIMALNAPLGDATCLQFGKVVYVYIAAPSISSTSSYAYIYITQQTTFPTLPSYNVYYYANNPAVIQAALSAQVGRLGVSINGDADLCPSSGSLRYGGIAKEINVYSQY